MTYLSWRISNPTKRILGRYTEEEALEFFNRILYHAMLADWPED